MNLDIHRKKKKQEKKNLQIFYQFKSAARVLRLMEQQSVVKMNQTETDWRVTPGNFVGDYIIGGLHI